MNPDELREVLDAAGRQAVPPPRAEFTRDLEQRLVDTRVVTMPRRHSPWRTVGAVAAAAAVIAAVLALEPDDPVDTIVTDPTSSTSTITTTSTSTTTTTVATTTSTAAPTSAPPPPATTTTAPATTTSATTPPTTLAPGVVPMRMSCTTSPRPAVTCTWSESRSDAFTGYHIFKSIDGGRPKEIGQSRDRTMTTKTDTDVQAGTRITYVIETFDDDGRTLERGEAVVSCC